MKTLFEKTLFDIDWGDQDNKSEDVGYTMTNWKVLEALGNRRLHPLQSPISNSYKLY